MEKPKYAPQARWQKENIESILIKPNRKLQLSARIQALIDSGKAESRQSYIINAVLKQLEQDEQ